MNVNTVAAMAANDDGAAAADNAMRLTLDQADMLARAGNLVSEIWGALASNEQLTISDFDDRMLEAGLVERIGGVLVLAPALTAAVVEVDVALAHVDDGQETTLTLDVDHDDAWGDDVSAAEARFDDRHDHRAAP